MISGQDQHSTLEVVEAGRAQEKMGFTQQPPLQAATAGDGGAALPQVVVDLENYPEVMHTPEYTAPEPTRSGTTVCGLRRNTFWIVAAIALVIVIGAAVGGGVGATRSSSDDKSSPSSPSTDSSSIAATSLLPNTHLAAVNYTIGNVQHHLVFFQTAGDGIYQTAWNSTARTWAVSPVVLKDTSTNRSDIFMTPTPITASYYACSSNTPNLTLHFLDPSSRLRHLTATSPTSPWSFGSSDTDNNVPRNASALASYACQHPSYPDDGRSAWFQAADGYYQIVDDGGSRTQVDAAITAAGITMVEPPANASLAIVPHYVYDYNRTKAGGGKRPYTSVFVVNSDVLYEYHYSGGEIDFLRTFDRATEPRLPPKAHLAAFSWGYNDTLGAINGMQVLYTMPDREGGGVSVLSNKNNADPWQSVDAEAEGNAFKGVARYSGLAATQAGRVYAVVEEGGGVELREWEYVPEENGYRVVGAVGTEV